jgi:uncharacterized protein YceK
MTRLQALIVLLSVSVGGCGTCANTLVISETGHESYRIYGGIRNDAEMISQSGDRIAAGKIISHAPITVPGALCAITLCTVDLPFSLVADTLTLPLCILFTEEHDKDTDKATPERRSDSGENR